MAQAGFDFLVVDAEHAPSDPAQCHALFQAIRSGSPRCQTFVRLPGNDYAETKRFLDAGANGVICPLINTVAEAEELVRSVKYPPDGDRGVGYARCNAYGFDFESSVTSANEETSVCIQIEHIKALDDLEAIVQVQGVDAVMIGPYDLSASMGITAQFTHPDYVAACQRILRISQEAGLASGIHVVQPDPVAARSRFDEGYSFLAYSLDITMLGTACREGLATIRKGKPLEERT
jgi:2-dehydro-3-deoxyglucarate aldolase